MGRAAWILGASGRMIVPRNRLTERRRLPPFLLSPEKRRYRLIEILFNISGKTPYTTCGFFPRGHSKHADSLYIEHPISECAVCRQGDRQFASFTPREQVLDLDTGICSSLPPISSFVPQIRKKLHRASSVSRFVLVGIFSPYLGRERSDANRGHGNESCPNSVQLKRVQQVNIDCQLRELTSSKSIC
jgi:hypothetical protein